VTLSAETLDSFGLLAQALGILDSSGSANSAWFSDPVGNGSNPRGLRSILGNDTQREALVAFVDEVLGPPERAQREDAVWVPLFRESAPALTIFAVVKAVAGVVHLGVAIEHTTTGAGPTVATRVHVPVFQLARGGAPPPTELAGMPGWLLLGKPGGRVEVTVDASLRTGAPPAPGQPSLGGVALTLGIPTSAGDALAVRLDLRDLQLPGAPAPRTFTLDAASVAELGPDVFQLLVGLVRAQADAIDVTQPALRPFAALTGLLGLRTVAGLAPLPLDLLPTAGVQAVVDWLEEVIANGGARDAWLGQLALLFGVGATVDALRDAITFPIGPALVSIGVRVEAGTSGHPALTPWAEVALASRAGAQLRVALDLLRADPGTGAVLALPDLRAEGVFGADAGGGAGVLLSGSPSVGSLHVGLALNAARRPAFVLTLHDVMLAGRHHDLLDLSTPQAALDSANDVISDAVTAALEGLGAPGALVARLLGTSPPAGVAAIDASAVLADPVAAFTGYWQSLMSAPAAMAEVLGTLRQLVAGGEAGAAPGSGTALAPWRVDLAAGAGLRFWREGADLVVEAGAALSTPVLGNLEVTTRVGLTLLRAGFTPPRASFGVAAHGQLTLARADHAKARFALGPVSIVEADAVGVGVTWSSDTGLRGAIEAEGLELVVRDGGGLGATNGGAAPRITVPLPRLGAGGQLAWDAPDFRAVEAALAALLGGLRVPVIDVALVLLGWNGRGARLDLAGLLGAQPELEVEAWLGELLLDCGRLRTALAPVTALLSGFSRSQPFGIGSERSPFRCPVAGEPRAPGLAVWLEPGCPPRSDDLARPLSGLSPDVPPEPGALVGALQIAARTLPDVADLLVGRDSLAEGLRLLQERWTGTDGLVGQPVALPDGVTPIEVPGYSYEELVALGSQAILLGDVFPDVAAPAAVLHVGCEATWVAGRPAGTAFDASADASVGALPATGSGTWFVRLPTPIAAALARPERGAVGEQASRLGALLASRTAPIAVVAYGACGAAALRAALDRPCVSDVITVGTPWAGLATDSLRSGLSGDALVLLERLLRANSPAWSDALLAVESSPLQILRGIVQRSTQVGAADLPSAGAEARRSGLAVRAVFGSLGADVVATGMGAIVADGLAARLAAAQAAAVAEGSHVAVHAALDLPVLDLDLGGLLVGVGATVELVRFAPEGAEGTLGVSVARGLGIDVHLGVHDGWLLGGPGAAQRDAEVRWMSVHVRVPFDDRPADAELVLHEARAFSAQRERWVVRAGADGVAATMALPEVRVILSGVIARLRAASPDLGRLLELAGVSRDGGLDSEGLDRLLHDTKATVLAARATAPADLAAALRALVPSASGAAAEVRWQVGPATLSIDLAARTLAASLHAAGLGLPALDVSVAVSSAGASAELSLGALDASAGGLRLIGRAGAGAATTPRLFLEWQAPGAAVRPIALLPTPDEVALEALVTVALPAVVAQGLASFCRANAGAAGRAALDTALDLLGLLGAAGEAGLRPVRLPLGLLDAPGAWLRGAVAPWRSDLVGSTVRLLDALAPITAPGRASPADGWPLAPGVSLRYGTTAGRLQLVLDIALAHTIGGVPVTTALSAGLGVGTQGPPLALLEAAVSVDGRGLRVGISPHVRVVLERPPPAAPLELFPEGPGLGSALAAAGEMALPPVLNALAARRTDAGTSLLKDIAAAVFDLGGALELLEGTLFTAARLGAFASDPAGRLLGRLPQLVATGAAALGRAFDPGAAVVAVTRPAAGQLAFEFGATGAVRLMLDAQSAMPAVVFSTDVVLPGLGRVVLESLRLSADGVQVAARFGPAVLAVGALTLRPMLAVRAGVAAGSFTRMLGLGLALDDAGAGAVEFRWALDATPPSLAVVTRLPGAADLVDTSLPAVVSRLLALGASIGVTLLVAELGPTLTVTAKNVLRGVVFTDVAASTSVDAALFTDLFEPAQLLARLERLLWNAATGPLPLSVTIDGTVTIALSAQNAGGASQRLGLSVSLAPGRKFVLASGNPQVELEVDASWVDPVAPPGLSIFVVTGTPAAGVLSFVLSPAVQIAGIGLRFSKLSGPLLELGPISLDAIALHLYGEAAEVGLGGGVRLQLDGLAIAPGGTGGSNGVASGILTDAGASGASNRPSFGPSLAVQQHPGQPGPSVSLRAGTPPGPWWVVVQRQLGPLYMERIGFDTVEQGGRVTRISLLLDGRVSVFGLTASVDQLSVSWLGGDVLDGRNWAVDLQGLAVAADVSGVSLVGGLLKSTTGGQISYVGMLLGRFGIYGLSVFGGYTDDHGSPSFFVFGALNGPIGGPPAFFVTGLGGGLGINRGLRVPEDMGRFNQYPFIQALDPAATPPADPMAELRRLSDYFPPVRGNFWFAAGISFTCFSLVDGIAVLSVSFGDGLEMNLFGLARLALPRPQAALVSIELGLLVRFSTREGLFAIRAQLTENSWLLYPDVRLTGGFAFVIWWKGPNRGQFVLTLGGYHPSFHRDGYPDVPRLGLCWQVTDEIVIKGGSYFALTSEALMAGVDVEVSADFGFAWARIGFGAHGIVYFDPFWFEVSAYASIAAGVEIDTFLGTIRFGISIGAEIRVWGPEFSGEASFKVGPVRVTVPFGSHNPVEPRILPWNEFVVKYLEDAGGKARALSAITGRGTLPSATGGAVAAPTADGTRERPFEVLSEFELTVTTTVPARRFDLGLATGPIDVPVKRSDGAPAALGLKPMRASALTTTVSLTLERWVDGAYAPEGARLRLLGANLVAAQPRAEGSTLETDAFPVGVWGAPETPGLPAPPLPKGDVLFAGNRVRLVSEAAVLHRGPEIDYYRVEAARRPLPLQAGGSARGDLMDKAGEVNGTLTPSASAAQALVMARRALFSDRDALGGGASALPAGVLPRGSYSNLARAAFVGDRAAPPLFGTLADGLARANGADRLAARQVPPERVAFSGLRPPRVAALLTAGSGVTPRPAATSVADKKTKRRDAPTLASVQSRLAVHLPVQLTMVALPATRLGKTVIASGSAPRTEVPGAARAYLTGKVGGVRGLDALVTGISASPQRRAGGRASSPQASVLAPGDLVVMTLPDAALDVDEQARPALGLVGAARVTMLKGDGEVALDAIRQGTVAVPPGVALMVVQASGANAEESAAKDTEGGMAGWHAGTRVAALGSHAALAPGCVLTVDATGVGHGVGWSVAAEIVAHAAGVTTQFARPARTVVVVLADADPQRVDGLALELFGATRATAPDGSARPATVVLRGAEAALVYSVVPTGRRPLAVRVRSGGNWRLCGVLAGDDDVTKVAGLLAQRGARGVARRVLAEPGSGCQVSWQKTSAAPRRTAATTQARAAKTKASKATTGRRPRRGG
jgi:hypothetical protein